MATVQTLSTPTLFNDPVLSDVKTKQICNGKTREYYAHKAILCAQSSYFLKAFTGNFKEATESIIELHDDDPDHFEFALRFIYSLGYNSKEVETKPSNNNKLEEAKFITGVYTVLDKYVIWRLLQPAADHLGEALKAKPTKEVLESVIRAHYSTCSTSSSVAGKAIASITICYFRELVRTNDFTVLLGKFPVFAADIAIYNQEHGIFNVRRLTCPCGDDMWADDGEIPTSVPVNFSCFVCGYTIILD